MTALVRILGIDPGLQCVGFGVIDSTGSQLSYVASGTITTTQPTGTSPSDAALLAWSIARRI